MPIEDSMLLFNYGSPKEARWNPFFPANRFLILSCSNILMVTRQMGAGGAKTVWRGLDWCWSPTFSDSFQDCFTWATQSPTQPFTPGWKAWWQISEWLLEPLSYLQLSPWFRIGIVVDLGFERIEQVAENSGYVDIDVLGQWNTGNVWSAQIKDVDVKLRPLSRSIVVFDLIH